MVSPSTGNTLEAEECHQVKSADYFKREFWLVKIQKDNNN